MPLYEAECGKCAKQADYFASIAERNERVPQCCGERMQRIITAAVFGYVQPSIAYESPTTGRIITTHRERRDDLQRSRARPWEGLSAELQESARKKRYHEEKEDKQITEAAHRAWHELPPSQRAVLDGSE